MLGCGVKPGLYWADATLTSPNKTASVINIFFMISLLFKSSLRENRTQPRPHYKSGTHTSWFEDYLILSFINDRILLFCFTLLEWNIFHILRCEQSL